MKFVVRMRGGLGNQLFILAFAYKLAEEYGEEDYEIVLDIREYETYKIRKFEILEFINGLHIRLFDKKKDSSIFYDLTRKAYHVFQAINSSLSLEAKVLSFISKYGLYYAKQNAHSYSHSKGSRKNIFGYFQEAAMVESISHELFSDMVILKTAKIENYMKLIEKKQAVIAVSIRCGADYINGNWPICSRKFYADSIKEIIDEKYLNKDVGVIIFSDDVEKAKKMKIYDDAIYVNDLSAIEQLSLMKSCSDFVISNSSFAWWGAYIGHTSDSIVIMPSAWYPTQNTRESALLYEGTRIREIE